jgi:hypothetical protein
MMPHRMSVVTTVSSHKVSIKSRYRNPQCGHADMLSKIKISIIVKNSWQIKKQSKSLILDKCAYSAIMF